MQVTCIPRKQVYYDWQSGFRVISCKPTKDCVDELELTPYGTFSISGNNLMGIVLGDELTVELEKDENNKYAASYHIFGSAGFVVEQQRIIVKEEQELAILKQFMTARQAKSVHSSYPNFIQLIMDGREDEIDTKKIKYVGKSYFGSYVKKLSAERDRLRLLPVAATFGIIDLNEIAKLSKIFHDKIELGAAFKENPYRVLCKHLDYPFRRADKVILPRRPEFRVSKQRCEFAVYDVLKNNEAEGNTRMSASQMARAVNDFAPELICKIVETVNECPEIYYNQSSKQCALQATYDNEKIIADNILSRLKHPQLTPMDWEKFKSIDGLECTDEQAEILRLACEQSVMMLTGGAGCVDCDTEFFTGIGWKRIADYQEGDLVLQYKQDGTAELVEPLAYFKNQCDYLWHFETKHSINQTVCDKHRIIYKWGNHEGLHETNVLELKQKSENNINWDGKFITQFFHFGHGIKLTDEQIRVMVAVMADGRYSTWENPNSISTHCCIRLKKGRKILRLRELLSAANIEYSEIVDKYGVTIFKFYAPERRKIYGEDWWNVNQHQAKIIYEEVVNWDGGTIKSRVNKREKPCFRTTEKQSADYIQYIFIINGWQSTIINCNKSPSRQNIKKIVYFVTTKHNNLSGLCFDNREGIIKTQFVPVATTDGYKYCFTVPSGMLVLRREDCVFVTGNCGKTSSVKAVVEMLEQNNIDYLLLTPTGISAKRLKEATGRPTSTIHRALSRGLLQEFNGVLILEESSMVGSHLLSTVFSQINRKCKIIFICDNAQLASISCGNIVQDIIDSKIVPTAQLTKVFRYGIGGIATVSTDTRNGKKFKPSEYPDYRFIPAQENVIDQIISAYDDLIVSGYSANDIMVLCPYNKTNVGTYAINAAIQKKYNAHPDTIAKYRKDGYNIMFKAGDKVVNTVNNYHMSAVVMNDRGEYEEMDEDGEHYTISVMNGDIGYVREVQTRKDAPWVIVEFDSGFGLFKPEDIKNLLLGYSLSVHRVQGAEAKAVIAIVCKEHVAMATRNLLYVALSRAKEKLIEIGDVDVINHALNIQENKERDTFLKDMLLKGGENSEKI